MKLLIGGSPCTHWSIAQTKNRETEPSGIGWQLFENYLIALDKFKPDFFLYENNKSMSQAIRAEITKRFGFEPICINSALLSAQNRQRLYWCGKRNPDGTYIRVDVEQPEDRGILLRDILESGAVWSEKGYTLKAQYYKSRTANMFAGHFPAPMAVEPVRIGTVESGDKSYKSDSQAIRVYSPNGKSVTLSAGGGGQGGKTGLYAVPVTDPIVTSVRYRGRDKGTKWEARSDNKSGALDTNAARSGCIAERVFIDSGNGKIKKVKSYPIYEVLDGFITIKEKQYPIKLADGFYIIRWMEV